MHCLLDFLDFFFISLVRDPDNVHDDSLIFHPTYAHQVFGENENIFGYKDLKIGLYYTAGSLNIYLGIKYKNRIENFTTEGLKADDVSGKITDLLTTGCYYTNIDEFLSKLRKEESFKPIGEKVDSLHVTIEGQSRTFEFYQCDATTPQFLPFHARLQTFIMWFVDAGSYIDTDDPQWTFFLW